jgi:hypothetical protein
MEFDCKAVNVFVKDKALSSPQRHPLSISVDSSLSATPAHDLTAWRRCPLQSPRQRPARLAAVLPRQVVPGAAKDEGGLSSPCTDEETTPDCKTDTDDLESRVARSDRQPMGPT